jgi:hypothetical protein
MMAPALSASGFELPALFILGSFRGFRFHLVFVLSVVIHQHPTYQSVIFSMLSYRTNPLIIHMPPCTSLSYEFLNLMSANDST